MILSEGAYNFEATSQRYGWTFRLIHFVAKRSIQVRAAGLQPPSLGPEDLDRGLVLFDQQCARCHGAPGEAREDFAEGMNPLRPPLVQPGRDWTTQQIYWTTTHGVHMTGMPAFMFHMTDVDIWAVAAWVRQMSDLKPDRYAARRDRAKAQASAIAAPDPAAGTPDPGADASHWLSTAVSAATSYRVCRRARNRRSVRRSPASAGTRSSPERCKTPPPAFSANPKAVRPDGAVPDMSVDPRDAAGMVAYLRLLRTP